VKPGTYPLELYRGDTFQWRFTLWDNPEQSDAVDLTGATVKAEIRDQTAGAVIVPLALTVTLPNIINATLSATACQGCPTAGVWDLQVTFPGAVVRTVLAGAVRTTPDVTDSQPAPMLALAGWR
jgi:hypothetical protein